MANRMKNFLKQQTHPLLAFLLSLQYCLFYSVSILYAEGVQVDSSRHNHSAAPRVFSSQNGAQVIDISEVNESGLSRNYFTQYNVKQEGLVLNNSGESSVSKLAGHLEANKNLKDQRSASLILNQVTGSGKSNLRGLTEIHGARAELVIANENGVQCDGCSFSNANRVTLSTGRVGVEENSSALSFDVQKGKVDIGGDGLDASGTDSLSIISRQLNVDGRVHGSDKTEIYLGKNRIRTQDGAYRIASESAQEDATQDDATGYATNISQHGSIESGSIVLQSTELGRGVRIDGSLRSNAGDISIFSESNVELHGNIESTGSAVIGSKRDITSNEAHINVEDTLLFSTEKGRVTHAGSQVSAGELGIQAKRVELSGSEFSSQRSFTANARKGFRSNASVIDGGSGHISLSSIGGLEILNVSSIYSLGAVQASSNRSLAVSDSYLLGGSLLSLKSRDESVDFYSSVVGSLNTLNIDSGGSLEILSSKIIAAGRLFARSRGGQGSQGSFDVILSDVFSGGDMVLSSQGSFSNSASSRIQSNNSIYIETLGGDFSNRGTISSGVQQDILAQLRQAYEGDIQDFLNTQSDDSLAELADDRGLSSFLYSEEELRQKFRPSVLSNLQGNPAVLRVVSKGALSNYGLLEGDAIVLEATGGDILNDTQASIDSLLQTSIFSNSIIQSDEHIGGSVSNKGSISSENLSIHSDKRFGVLRNQGALRASLTGSMTLQATSIINESSITGGNIEIIAKDLVRNTSQSSILAFSALNIKVRGSDDALFENSGLLEAKDLNISSDVFRNYAQVNLISVDNEESQARLDVDEVYNEGSIVSEGDMQFFIGSLENRGTLRAGSTSSLTVRAQNDILNEGGLIAADSIKLEAGGFFRNRLDGAVLSTAFAPRQADLSPSVLDVEPYDSQAVPPSNTGAVAEPASNTLSLLSPSATVQDIYNETRSDTYLDANSDALRTSVHSNDALDSALESSIQIIAGSGIENTGNSRIQSQRLLQLITKTGDILNESLLSGGTVAIDSSGSFINRANLSSTALHTQLEAPWAIDIQAKALIQNRGRILANSGIRLNSGLLLGQEDFSIENYGTLRSTASSVFLDSFKGVLNQGGNIEGASVNMLAGGNIRNVSDASTEGRIVTTSASGSLLLQSLRSIENRSVVDSASSLHLVAHDGIENFDQLLSQSDILLDAKDSIAIHANSTVASSAGSLSIEAKEQLLLGNDSTLNAARDILVSTGTLASAGSTLSAGNRINIEAFRSISESASVLSAGTALSIEAGTTFGITGTQLSSTNGSLLLSSRDSLTAQNLNVSIDGGIALHADGQLTSNNLELSSRTDSVRLSAGTSLNSQDLSIDAQRVINLSSQGQLLYNRGSLTSSRAQISLSASGRLENTELTLSAHKGVNLSSEAMLLRDVSIASSQEGVSLSALSSIASTDARIVAHQDVQIQAGTLFRSQGASSSIVSQQGRASIFAASGLENNVSITAAQGLLLESGASLLNTAALNISGAGLGAGITIKAGATLSNHAVINAASRLVSLDSNEALLNTANITAGNLDFNSGASLENSGTLTARDSLSLEAATTLTNTGALQSTADAIHLSSGGDLSNTGDASALKAIILRSEGGLTNSGSLISRHEREGSIALIAEGALVNSAVLNAAALQGLPPGFSYQNAFAYPSITLKSNRSIRNTAELSALGNISLAIESDPGTSLENTASITSHLGRLLLSSSGRLENNGALLAGTPQVPDTVNTSTIVLQSKGDLENHASLTAQGSVRIVSERSLDIQPGALQNGGIWSKRGSVLLSAKTGGLNVGASLRAYQDINVNLETLDARDGLSISSAITSDEGAIYLRSDARLSNTGNISAEDSVNLRSKANLSNTASIRSRTAAIALISEANLSNRGALNAVGDIHMITDRASDISVSDFLLENTAALTSQEGAIRLSSANALRNSGLLSSSSAIHLNAIGDLASSAAIQGARSVSLISSQGDLTNTGDIVLNPQDTTISLRARGGLVNQATLSADAALELSSGGVLSLEGDLSSRSGSVALHSGALARIQGSLTAQDDITVNSGASLVFASPAAGPAAITAREGAVYLFAQIT